MNDIIETINLRYKHRDEYIRGFDSIDEGIRSFDCLIMLLEDEVITADDLPDYGMEFPDYRVDNIT